jgi:hypothetical protein
MLGQFGQLASLLRNAGQMKQNLEQMNERLGSARFVGEAGGGEIRATVNGRGELVALKIEPALSQSGDLEMLEDLIVAAVRDGVNRSRQALQKETQAALGGLSVPGIDKLLGSSQ